MRYLISAMVFMALITYLIRFLPFAIFKKNIENRFFQSFLYYVPYSVLSAMTFPAIFYSTGDTGSALAGTLTAIILGFMHKGLVTITIASVVIAYLVIICF